MEEWRKKLQEAFGYTDEQLLEEFKQAEAEWLKEGGTPPTEAEIKAMAERLKERKE